MPEPNQSGLSDNAAGAIAYITIVPAIVFLVLEPYSKSAYVRFHAWQSIFLNIAAIIIWVAFQVALTIAGFFVPFFIREMLSLLVGLAWVLIWILCVVNAINGKRFSLPIIGPLADKQAGV